ncbi:hypothetical protein Mapa_001710 [Marchantia paleacea]|nr:hypothetical protein Mapa_001710 [Marchantia paleacea]
MKILPRRISWSSVKIGVDASTKQVTLTGAGFASRSKSTTTWDTLTLRSHSFNFRSSHFLTNKSSKSF